MVVRILRVVGLTSSPLELEGMKMVAIRCWTNGSDWTESTRRRTDGREICGRCYSERRDIERKRRGSPMDLRRLLEAELGILLLLLLVLRRPATIVVVLAFVVHASVERYPGVPLI